MNAIAKSIRTLRLKHRMTQSQLAGKLGVQYQTVSKWETGITVPDAMMFPKLADLFDTSIDEIFGRKFTACAKDIPQDTQEFLLRTYSQMYAPEAGPWNLSVENKYLEYRFAEFFEKHFTVSDNANLCNIGIGAGEWDIYLSYKLKGGSLTSIDKVNICCRQLEKRLILEENPNKVHVLCADAMSVDFHEHFEIVTMVGSTAAESGIGLALLEKAMDFVKPDGALYYQTLEHSDDCNSVIEAAYRNNMKLSAIFADNRYGFDCYYYKFTKQAGVSFRA